MRCKLCGSDNPDNARFCCSCGSQLPPHSKAKPIFAALGKMLCYIALFSGVQFLVSFVYTISIAISASLDYIKHGAAGDPFNSISPDEIMNSMMGNGMHYSIIVSGLLTILILALFYRISGRRINQEAKFNPIPLQSLPLIITGALSFQFFVGITMSMLPIPADVIQSFEEMNAVLNEGSLILQIIAVAIVTPVTEELVFRGMILTRLNKALPLWLSVAISSIAFGIMHGHIISFIYASILGAVMALLMIKFKSICAPILFHVCFNAAAFIYIGENQIVSVIIYIVSILALAAVTAMIIYTQPSSKIKY